MNDDLYYCEICDYSTKRKSKINLHHIIPKELNGTNDSWNLIYLCPSCHINVYIPNSNFGNHSIKSERSIIINKKLLSTDGILLNYIYNYGNEFFSLIKNKKYRGKYA